MPDWQPIHAYAVSVDMANASGTIRLTLAGDIKHAIAFDNLTDLAAATDLLRHERPVHFDPDTQRLATGPEPPGEGE